MTSTIFLNSRSAIGKSSDFTTTLSSMIYMPAEEGWQIAFHSGTIYYSFPNISAEKGNNIIRYTLDGITPEADIIIPTGTYSLPAINEFFQGQLFLRGHYTGTADSPVYSITIAPNYNTLRTVVVLSGTSTLLMNAGNLYLLLGIEYTVTSMGTNRVNINDGVEQIHIRVSIVSGSYNGGISGNTIYAFTPSSVPGSALIEVPNNLIWFPLSTNNFQNIRCQITDQNGKELDLRGEETNVVLTFKKSAS